LIDSDNIIVSAKYKTRTVHTWLLLSSISICICFWFNLLWVFVDFCFVHLILDTCFRFSFVCHPLLLCLFLACLTCLFFWVCHSIFHLMLSNSSIWAFIVFLICTLMQQLDLHLVLFWILCLSHYFGDCCMWSLFLEEEWWVNLLWECYPRGILEWVGIFNEGVQTLEGYHFGGLDWEDG